MLNRRDRGLAAELLVNKVMTSVYGQSSQPASPVARLRRLADYFNAELHLSAESLDGCVEMRSDRNPVIRLSATATTTRSSFTFAHELAHLILVRFGEDVDILPDQPSLGAERLCDAIAATILLPTPWLRSEISGAPNAGKLIQIASKSHVSPTVVAIRLRDIGHRVQLFRVRKLNDGRWIVAAAPLLPHQVRRVINLDPHFSDALNTLQRGSEAKFRFALRDHSGQYGFSAPASAIGGRDVAHIVCDQLTCRSQYAKSGEKQWRLTVDHGGELIIPNVLPDRSNLVRLSILRP